MVAGIGAWTPALFVPHARSIGGIVAEVTIEENERDELVITEHPIEQGAPIADHAYKRPSVVQIRAGWSRQKSIDLSAETGVYGLLLSWQASLMPFDFVTGKRSYADMMIAGMTVMTDQSSEFALMVAMTLQQVILVSTENTNIEGLGLGANSQADPKTTATSMDVGSVPLELTTRAEGAQVSNAIQLSTGTGTFTVPGLSQEFLSDTGGLGGVDIGGNFTFPTAGLGAPSSNGGVQP